MSARRSPFADSAAMPLVQEMEGDAAWDEWSRAMQQQEAGFAKTAPASLDFAPTEPTPLQRAPSRGEVTLEQVVQEARRNNRVCPLPAKWQSMYALLAASASKAPLPPPPLAGVVWERTPAMPKRMCFIEHLEWAAAQGCLPAVHAFIKSLADSDWHHAA